MIASIGACLLFAGSIICGHRASRLLGGASANFWRLVMATVMLGAWSFLAGIGLGGGGFTYFFISGVMGFGVGDVALYQALPRLGSRLTMLFTQCLAAPFGIIIERCWLGTRLSWLQILSIAVIMAGVALALAPQETEKHDPREWRLGSIYGVLSALGGALGAVFSRRAFMAVSDAHQSIDGINAAFQRILGGLLVGAVFLAFIRWQKRQPHRIILNDAGGEATASDSLHPGWWVAGNALAGPTLGVSCMQWALSTTPTGIVLAIIALTPLAVIPLARIFENERPTARSLWGSFVAVAGVLSLILVK